MVVARPQIFAHIPKTAGTTLYRIFSDHYDCRRIFPFYFEEQDWDRKNCLNYDLFFSHIQRIARSGTFAGGLFDLFTSLRQPVSLIHSLHQHIQRERENPNEAFYRKFPKARWIDQPPETTSLKGMLESGDLVDNLQTRWLALFFGGEMCDEFLLDEAKIFLRNCKWFGVLEEFDLSYYLLCFVQKWRPVDGLFRENQAQMKSTNQESYRDIDKFVALDRQLYNFGLDLLESRASNVVNHYFKEKYLAGAVDDPAADTVAGQLRLIATSRYEAWMSAQVGTTGLSGILPAEAPFHGRGWHRREYSFDQRAYRWNGADDSCDVDLPCCLVQGGQVYMTIVAWHPGLDFSKVEFSVNGIVCVSKFSVITENDREKIIIRIKVPKHTIAAVGPKFSRLIISNFSRQRLCDFTPVPEDSRQAGFAFEDIHYLVG
jgi:hypothetical protein